jgi:anti-sigma regulatory factor (Ser/Thr protein kinase)
MPAIGARPEAAKAVRAHIRMMLPAWQVDDLTAETFELVVSELVANAVNASANGRRPGPVAGRQVVPVIQVCLYSDGRRLLAEVWDQAPDCPRPRLVGDLAENGRGLNMITDLGARWGWWMAGTRKCVWAEMDYPGPSAALAG